MSALTVAVSRECDPDERRVAVVPDQVAALTAAGWTVLVQAGAGTGAWFADEAYARAGADVVPAAELARAGVVVTVGRPPEELVGRLRAGQAVVGLLAPLADPGYADRLARRGLTVVSLDLLPRTLSRAQPMDALTSQANVAGYKAALVAANAFGRYFPMLITAAGTARPARVLVLGAGVAGLQAMGTARRLGAVVSGYDIRPQSRSEVESVGATFLDLSAGPTPGGTAAATPAGGGGGRDGGGDGGRDGTGGYARALAADETRVQQDALAPHIARHDVIITTAQLPGRPPPVLVSEDAVKQMAPGSVIVDIAAGRLGGNVALSPAAGTVVTDEGVTIVAAGNLAATVPTAASAAYSRNVAALLRHLAPDGQAHDGGLAVDLTDEIQAGVVVSHGGRIVHPAVARLLPARRPAEPAGLVQPVELVQPAEPAELVAPAEPDVATGGTAR